MKTSRTLVIGDIHGGYKALIQVVERASVKPNDTLIFLGDYVDGWSESPEVIDFLIEFSKTHKSIFLMGNHDELLLDWLKHKKVAPTWLKHGGDITMKAYAKLTEETKLAHIAFIEGLENYHLDNNNRLFLHAGFTHIMGVKYEYFPALFYWDRTLWEMALALNPALKSNDTRYPARLKHYHEIFIGHTPTVRIGKSVPVNAANVWNLDTGAAFDGPLTIMDIDTKQYWQSDIVESLYSKESSRNKFW